MDLSLLNPPQKEAVMHKDGPLLILAGAGSGKTRVITYRAAYLIENGCRPDQILAVTFTNKAAGEMRERVESIAGAAGRDVWVSTFHSFCVRVLRGHAERICYKNKFAIYDDHDQKAIMKQLFKKFNVDTDRYSESGVLTLISSAKNELIGPEGDTFLSYCLRLLDNGEADYAYVAAEMYREYQKALMENNCMDFDDLIMNTVKLFTSCSDVLKSWQNHFRYIMVDEYQDTNHAQFELVRLLADSHKNLCVVGDDDQSIYGFRGADIRNILEFEDQYPGTRVIKLEQNYRSTKTILAAANGVIRHNVRRKVKTLWTTGDDGVPVEVVRFEDGVDEGKYIVDDIIKKGYPLKDCAVLYRMNHQSRALEEACGRAGIPCKIVGGVGFYQRKEVKDLLAYLKVVDNPDDNLSAARIINVPKRGIGAGSVEKLAAYALEYGLSFMDAVSMAGQNKELGRSAGKVTAFSDEIDKLVHMAREGFSPAHLIEHVYDKMGYRKEIEKDIGAAEEREANIQELIDRAGLYESETGGGLSEFLEWTALFSDERKDDGRDKLLLMTLHNAKGLEFKHVYICGLDERILPHAKSIAEGDVEEERRLCYVGITRAMETLTLTQSEKRFIYGQEQDFFPSRFLEEIPGDLMKNIKVPHEKSVANVFEARNRFKAVPKLPAYGPAAKAAAGFNGAVSTRPAETHNTFSKPAQPPVTVGDRVMHEKYGAGTVVEVMDTVRDYLISVDFDAIGIKKMFSQFADLKKL